MFMLQSQVSFAQWELEVSARIKKEETKKRMEGVTVTIKRNGTVWKTLKTDANGGFGAMLPSDAIYMVAFSMPGHVTKRIEFSTKFVPEEDAKYGLDFAGFEVTLFEKIEDLDVSILDQPIAKIAFDPEIGYMDFDAAYTKSIKKELDRLKQELADRLKAEEEKRKLKQKNYDAAIDAGDKAFNGEDWAAAKPYYEKALVLFPKEAYPATQLGDISAKLAAAAGATKMYNAAIAKADAAFQAKDYDQALVAYQNASNAMPDEQYPKDQLKAVNSILAELKKVDKEYNELMAAGNKSMLSSDYDDAKEKYNSALKLKGDEQIPKDKLAKIATILAEQGAKEKGYTDAITAADAALEAKEYDQAVAAYQKALGLKPTETYPQQKIDEVKLLKENAKKMDENYNSFISSADAAMVLKDYATAKSNYEQALALKASETYPNQKIEQIKELMGASAKLDADYENYIKEGDNLFSAKKYEEAKGKFNAALGLKSAEQGPKDKIKLIEEALAALAAEEAGKKAIEAEYKALITAADGLLGAKDYDQAKLKYNAALGIKSGEEYPTAQLKEIEVALAEFARLKAAEELALAAGAEKETKYNAAIAAADNSFNAKEYDQAKLKYNAALGIKSGEEYPTAQLKEIEVALAEVARLKAAEESALAAGAEKDTKYNAAIAAADNSFKEKEYAAAKLNYNKAIAIKPGESYPKEQLTAIESAIASSDKNAADALAAESAKKKSAYFDAVIAEAEAELTAKNYKEAITKFTQALGVIPGEKYPTDKIKEITEILANIESAKVNKNLEKEKLAQKYKTFIASADQKISAQNYAAAKSDYESALLLKPSETYPKKQLTEIERLLAIALAKENEISLTANAQNQKKEDYDQFIKNADAAFSAKNYTKALLAYNQALAISPKEAYPKSKIIAIEKIVADLSAQENVNKAELLAEKEKREKYDQLIFNGNRAMKLKDYSKAKVIFSNALALYSTEKYPQTKLAEIEALLNEQNQPKKVLVSKGTVGGGRAKINKDKENEIEALMSSLLAKKSLKKEEKLQNDKNEFNKLEENRISGGIERTKEAQEELATVEEGNLAIIARGDQFHQENDEEIQVTFELLNKAAATRVKNADEKRTEAKEEQAIVEEGNLAIIARGDQFHKENDEALQATIELFNKTAATRVEKADEKRGEAKEELATVEEGNLAIIARGDEFHKENDEEIQVKVELFNKSAATRVEKADKKRNEADVKLKVYNGQQEVFIEKQNELSSDKVEAHHIYVDNIQERELIMIDKGDELRAANRADISEVAKYDAEKRADRKKRAEDIVFDVKQYKQELGEAEKVLLSGSVDRTKKNTENIKAVSENLTAMKKEKVNHYKLNVVELTDFKKRIEMLEANTLEKAAEVREENQKINAEYVANLQKESVAQDQKYYEELVDIKTYKKEVAEVELKKQEAADKQRVLANKEVLKAMENLNAVAQGQEMRYAAFKTKLEDEKERIANFSEDLQTLEQQKIAAAKIELKGYYMGENRVSKDSELASKYPQGITEETVESGNSVVIRRIKVTGNHADVYERVFYTWGGSYFYKNGKNITQSLWDKESIEK